MQQSDKKSSGRTAPKDEEVMQVGADAIIEQEDKPVDESLEERLNNPRLHPGGVEFGAEDLDAALDAPGAEETAPKAETDPAAAQTPAPGGAKSELDTLRDERDSYLDLARRERADFDNYRKRMQREMEGMKRASLAAFLKEFFGPLDDMDRVLQESEKNHSFESLVQGVRIMEQNFWRALAKAGVKRIDAKGKQFDPNLHEAMAAVPSADVPPNTVLEVYDNGYKLDEFILRPARVVVSRAPDAAE